MCNKNISMYIILFFGLYLSNIVFRRKLYKIQNSYVLNMFTFDMLSVCHSLFQSFAGIALFIFFTEDFIKYKLFFLLFNPYFIFTLFALNLVIVNQKNIYFFVSKYNFSHYFPVCFAITSVLMIVCPCFS